MPIICYHPLDCGKAIIRSPVEKLVRMGLDLPAQKGRTMLKREAVKGSNQVKVTFVIPNDPDQPRISVLGDFNNWDPDATVFVKRQNNTRSVSTTVDAGQRYLFRYRTADGEWVNDDSADAYEPNEHGSHNCVLIT